MYKVLITDDEPMIREGLRTLIDWEALGFSVSATAANGKEALGLIALQCPDLLIVDIRMPGMSGLELVEAVRQFNPAVHVLILSGYADFDYAKKAITLNIDGYLLKPVDEAELIDHLVQLRNGLDRERLEKRDSGKLQHWSRRQKLLLTLLSADHDEQWDERMPEELAEAGIGWSSCCVVLVKLLGIERSTKPGCFEAIRERLTAAYEESGKGIVTTVDSALVLLLPDRLETDEERRRVYLEIESLIQEPDIHLVVAGGASVTTLGEIRRSYGEAAELAARRFFYESGQLIVAETLPLHQGMSALPEAVGAGAEAGLQAQVGVHGTGVQAAAEGRFDIPSLSDKLYLAMDVGNAEAIAKLVTATGRGLIQYGRSEDEIRSTFAAIVTAVAGKLSQSGDEQQLDNGQLSACMSIIYQRFRYCELERDLSAILPTLIRGSCTCSSDRQIRKMIDLIQRNYHENLKLETLAEVFSYNSAYLGKLFKSETGEYFNTYLDKVRIEKAKELLEQGLMVYQVAEKVGYANVDYFHGKFRKYVGVSPSAYRKK